MKTTYCKQFNVISIQHYENGRSNANVFWHSFHSKRNALWNRTIFGWKVLSLVIFFMLLNWSLICLMWWVPGLHYVHCTLHIYFEMLWNELEMPSKCFEIPLKCLWYASICFNLLQYASKCLGKKFPKMCSKLMLFVFMEKKNETEKNQSTQIEIENDPNGTGANQTSSLI